jgi:hypothetical protein
MENFSSLIQKVADGTMKRKDLILRLGNDQRGKIDRALKMIREKKIISVSNRPNRLNEKELEILHDTINTLMSGGYYPSLADIQNLVFFIMLIFY